MGKKEQITTNFNYEQLFNEEANFEELETQFQNKKFEQQ
jgi:hypothetical protein